MCRHSSFELTDDMGYSDNKHIVFSAYSAGELALQRLRFSTYWRVLGVYRNCFYCQDEEGDIICIGTDRIDRGPFTINGAGFGPLLTPLLSTGTILQSCGGNLYFRDTSCCIATGGAEAWDATFPVHPEPLITLEEDSDLLSRLAQQSAPEESLGQLIAEIFNFGPRSSKESPFLPQLLHKRVREVIRRLREEKDVNNQAVTAVLVNHLSGLIGAGYGLTPSGDDFCCGIILGIARVHDPAVAQSLAVALSLEGGGRTTSISLAFLRSLAKSRVSETQDVLLRHFGNSGAVDMQRILLETASHGSTSGWDMLAGFAFGIDLFRQRCAAGDLHYEHGCVC